MSSYSGRFRLKIDDEGRSRLVPIRLGAATIGRDPDNTVRLEDRNVSRRHLRITREAKQVWIEDLSSANGTRVNGELVKGRTCVYRNDVIQVGDFTLEIDGESLKARNDDTTERTIAPDLEDTRVDIRGSPAPEVTQLVDRAAHHAPPVAEATPRPGPEPEALPGRPQAAPHTSPPPVLLALLLIAAVTAIVCAALLISRRPPATVHAVLPPPVASPHVVGPPPDRLVPPIPEAPLPAPATGAATESPDHAETVSERTAPAELRDRPARSSKPPPTAGAVHEARGRQAARPMADSEPARIAADKLSRQAEAMVKAGELADAKPLLERCLKLDVGYARCHRTLGIIYARTGDAPTAAYHYGRYLDLAPDAPDAPDIRRLLAAYRGQR